MTVQDLMTSGVMTIRGTDKVELARYQMETAELRHLPVVDEAGLLIGMLSISDLFRSRGFRRTPRTVAEIMTRNIRTATLGTPASEAVRLMLDLKISALPVVVEGKLVGIVTDTDFLSLAYRMLLAPQTKVA